MIDSGSPVNRSLVSELFGWFFIGGTLGLLVALIAGYLLRVSAPMIFILFPAFLWLRGAPGPPEGIGAWVLLILFTFGTTFVLYGLLGAVAGSLFSVWRTWRARHPKRP